VGGIRGQVLPVAGRADRPVQHVRTHSARSCPTFVREIAGVHRGRIYGSETDAEQEIIGLSAKRFASLREHQLRSNHAPVTTDRGLASPICKLSHKLSRGDEADAAYQQLTRQVHQRHVLTLWDTTSWCSRRESNP